MRVLIWVALFLFLSIPAYAARCGTCHGTPPKDGSHQRHSGSKTMKPSYGDTGYTGKNASFSDSYGFNCGNCHPADAGKHRNGGVEIDLSGASSGGLKAFNSGNPSFDAKEKTCSGVYCHSDGVKNGNLLYVTSPAWNRTAKGSRCQECHGSPPAYRGSPGRPNGHFNIARGSGHLLGIHWDSVKGHSKESFKFDTATQMGCSTCHFETVRRDVDTTFVDTATGLFTCVRCHEMRDGDIFNYSVHVNGRVEVVFAPVKVRSKAQMMVPPRGWKRSGGRGRAGSFDESEVLLSAVEYNASGRSCANVPCHLGAEKVSWHDSVGCGECHAAFRGSAKKKE